MRCGRVRRLGFAAHHDLALALEHLATGIGEAQAAVAFAVHFQQAGCHQLAKHAAPGAFVQVAADAVGAQLIVSQLFDALVSLPRRMSIR